MSASETDYLTHDHYFLSRSHDDSARRTLWVVGLTAVMMVGEIIAGLVYGSMALLADGFHMATHAGALAVAAGAYAYAKRHAANRRFSFGTGKVGDLAGFASALVLGIVALGIAGESIGRLIDPRSVAFGQATLVANGIVGIQIHELKDRLGNTDLAGATPALLTRAGAPVYKYADHARLAARIEEAAKRAGR